MASQSAARAASRPARRPSTKAPASRNGAKKADLRVVRPEDRVRTVGAISTAVASFFFVVLFALAGLHAVVVQTQASLDGVNADITALEELRVVREADLAWAESAVGLETTALAAGLVPAAATVILAPIPPGELTPPLVADPFSSTGPGSGTVAEAAPAGETELIGNPG